MMNDAIRSIKLERYATKDVIDKHVNGSLTVIWRDWDNILSEEPKMVYISSVNPGEIKGPHLHTKRDSYFVCTRGKVVFIAKDLKGNYHEIESSEEEPVLVQIPKNHASAHINLSDKASSVLALASIAWRPNDNEMVNVSFDDYNWDKWKKK
jgi:dTDP-4-dehydrorhamnose 3,5-epimerase